MLDDNDDDKEDDEAGSVSSGVILDVTAVDDDEMKLLQSMTLLKISGIRLMDDFERLFVGRLSK